MNHTPLTPRKVYLNGLPPNFPEGFADDELPMQVLPPDGFSKYGEFWGAMGQGSRWKPAIYLIVTLPVLAPTIEAGPQVTSHVLKYHFLDAIQTDSDHFEIAGRLVKADSQTADSVQPVPEVEMLLKDMNSQHPAR